MTKIANIHYNLAAWTSATGFALGARVSSTGQAYQCIQGGVSGTTAPNGVTPSFPDGTAIWMWLSAIDYTSLGAWQADTTNYPLVLAQPYEVHLWNNGPVNITNVGGGYFQLTGHTTSATNTITIKCAPGESFRDKLMNQNLPLAFNASAGVAFVAPATGTSNANWFYFTDANVIIDGIQFQNPNSADASSLVQFGGAAARMQNCIADGFGQSGGAVVVGADTITGQLTLANCLIVDRVGTGDGATVFLGFSAVTVVNCTVVAVTATTGVGGIWAFASGSTMTVRNCIAINYDVTGAVATGGTANVDHSLFSAASLTGSGVTTGAGCQFGQTAAGTFAAPYTNFRLLGTSLGVNNGTTDTTDIPTSDDIGKTIRPQGAAWDIGAWEFSPPVSMAFGPQAQLPPRVRIEMVPY